MDEKRELAARIVDLFDDLLYQKGIEIPCEDSDEQAERYEGDNEARLYGMEYWTLVDKIEEMLKRKSYAR